MKNLKVNIVSGDDNIQELVRQINQASWDEANGVDRYSTGSLQAYLEKEDTVFLACYKEDEGTKTLAGMASGRIEHKPDDFSKWLYIDEVDTCSDLRKRGVATAMMQTFLQLAKGKDCEEVWLCTEKENLVARRFYESLNPDGAEDVIGYTFKLGRLS